MTMIITPVLALEELRFPLEILSAALVFLMPFTEKKERFRAKMAGWFVIFTAMALLYFPIFLDKNAPRFWMLQGVWYAFFALCPVLYAKLCFEIGWCDALFLDISAFAAQNIVYSLVNQFLARDAFPMIREHLLLYVLLSAAACVLVYGIAWRLFASKLIRCNGRIFPDTPKNLFFYSLLFGLTIVCLFYYQNLFENAEGIYAETSWLPGLLYSVLMLTIQYSLFRTQNFSSENEILERMLTNSERYYEMSKENIEIINRKCHDLKHQLKILEMVSEEERAQYIEEARANLAFYQQLVHSENPVINTILAEKGLFCEERGISLSCSVDDVDLGFIRVADLYAMLGNALDNAVHYVEQFDEEEMRIISFRISGKKNFLNMQVVNPYRGPQLPAGELPASTQKGEPGSHGYGLKSIRYLAQKYGGGMELSTADGLFTLQITLPQGGR